MILTRVKRGLKTMKAATASQLAADLSLARKDVEAVLDFWVHRGDVRACEERVGPACGTTCTKCPIGRAAGHRAVGQGVS
ncbi:MAG: FeoC-like transcriptional regulator [Spirochaetaceae bacterium]